VRARRRSGFQRSARHAYMMELELEFGRAIPAQRAKEVARRVTDALRLSRAEVGQLEGLTGCRLVCHPLRKVLTLDVGTGSEPAAADAPPR
jgi:hypothetical protein